MKNFTFLLILAVISTFVSPHRLFSATPDEIISLGNKAAALSAAGKPDEALPHALKMLETSEKVLGKDHPDTGGALNTLASIYQQMGEFAKAEPLYNRALQIYDKSVGAEHPDTAILLGNLAELYESTGDYSKAEPLFAKVLRISEKSPGPEHSDTATAYYDLASLYRKMGNFAKAEPLYKRALIIREKALGADHPKVASDLTGLGALYTQKKDFTRAEALFERALKIETKALGPDHPDSATTLNNMAYLYKETGRYQKSEAMYLRALRVQEKVFGAEHPATAISTNNLASLYEKKGAYAKAEPLYKRSLQIRERAYGPEHPDTVASLNNLALFYANMGDYAKAEPLYKRSLQLSEKSLGPAHPYTATALNNLAMLYDSIGDYAKAETICVRALQISEKLFGPEHPDTGIAFNNLAIIYHNMEEYSKAEPLLKRTVQIWEKSLGPEHPDTATALNNLAYGYAFMDNYAKAEPIFRKVLRIREQTLGAEHPDVASSLNNLASLYGAMGEFGKAETLFLKALRIREKALGTEHPDRAVALNNLALNQAHLKKHAEAVAYFRKGMAIDEKTIGNVFFVATEEQKIGFIKAISWSYDTALSLISGRLNKNKDAVRFALELVLRRKGIVLDAQSRMAEGLQKKLSGKVKEEWQQLSEMRSRYSRLVLNKPEQMTYDDYNNGITSLQSGIEGIEARLSRESNLIAGQLSQRHITVDVAAKALPVDTVLVEYVKIRGYDFDKARWSGRDRYIVFVLDRHGEIELHDLGDFEKIELEAASLMKSIRQSLVHSDKAVEERIGWHLRAFYDRVWSSLSPALKNSKKVFISPDGQLNLIPFAALLDAGGQSLSDTYVIAYLASGRELVAANISSDTGNGLFLAADPAFSARAVSAGSDPAYRSRNFSGKFNSLPGTRREAEVIAKLVSGKERKTILTGEKATETAVKNTKAPFILHLATHGFFLEETEKTVDKGSRGLFLKEKDIQKTARRDENPLVRSGLAFAGADNAGKVSSGDDGILTALEITGMDLYGTELVVLSACETGAGDVKSGEGVFGLRRAFTLAGAKKLVMSLWPVSDDVTVRQMELFYRNIAKKMPHAVALRDAQLILKNELNQKYGYTPVFLWAPFIIQGASSF